MINIGDLVEWSPIVNINIGKKLAFGDLSSLGVAFEVKTLSLDGKNNTKLFRVYFPNHQQYWIDTSQLTKLV